MRFMGALHDSAVREHVARFDWRLGKVVGFWVDGVLRGAAELRFLNQRQESAALTAGVVLTGPAALTAEAALTVETAWQCQGAGTRLLRRALLIARNRSAVELRLNSFADNQRLQHLARKFGAQLTCDEGEAEAVIDIHAGDYLSLRDELVGNWIGSWQAWLGQWSAASAA